MKLRRLLPFALALAVLGLVAAAVFRRDQPAPPVENPSPGGYGQRAYDHTAAILAFGPRPPASEGLEKVQAYVAEQLRDSGWVTTFQSFEAPTPEGPVKFRNVVARFPGSAAPEELEARVPEGILAAHIDSKLMSDATFLGADDAASAVAAIVEIARVLAEESPELAERLELVFFDGEEAFRPNITPNDGLYGSKHYARQWRGRDSKPRFGTVLDMIGHRDLRVRIPADTPAHLRDSLMTAAKQEQALDRFGVAPGAIIDDHVPLNQAGIPTIDVIGDFARSDWWHTEADNLDLISAESLDISIRVTLRMLRQELKK